MKILINNTLINDIYTNNKLGLFYKLIQLYWIKK